MGRGAQQREQLGGDGITRPPKSQKEGTPAPDSKRSQDIRNREMRLFNRHNLQLFGAADAIRGAKWRFARRAVTAFEGCRLNFAVCSM